MRPARHHRASRILTHVGLMGLAVVTHKDPATLAFVTPIFVVAASAAARNSGPELDVIDVFWFLISLFFVVRPAQILDDGSLTMYAGRAPLHYAPDIIILAFTSIYLFVLTMYLVLPCSTQPSQERSCTTACHSFVLPSALGFGLTLLFSGGFANMMAARYDRVMDQVSPFVSLGQGLLIASAVVQVASLASASSRRLTDWSSLAFCLALLLLAFNPLNTARFALVSAWLPIALIAFPLLRRPAVFALISMAATLIVMPILSITTRFGLDFETAFLNSKESSSIFELPYIDTFDTLVHGIYYAHTFGFQYGAKLVSILLCFVPRSVWPDKPIVSALDIGNHLYAMGLMGTPNLSMPIMGDFYMDFGLGGVLVGSIAVGLLMRALLRVQSLIYGLPVMDYLIIGALPILVRGAVGAVIPLAVCTLIALSFLSLRARRERPTAWRSPHELQALPGIWIGTSSEHGAGKASARGSSTEPLPAGGIR